MINMKILKLNNHWGLKVLFTETIMFSTQHVATYTMWDKLRVFSGSSGNLGILCFDLSGTHRKDFLNECPICLLGDFCKKKFYIELFIHYLFLIINYLFRYLLISIG